MKTNEAKMLSVLFEAGVPFPQGGPSEMDKLIKELLTLRRLAIKHHRLSEMKCNGEGYIRGQRYYGGQINDWARREYGHGVKSAYLGDSITVFDLESDKVEGKIKAIAERLGLRVEFQGDPRGYTVKVFKGGTFLDIQG
jgi:hypothetical protein